MIVLHLSVWIRSGESTSSIVDRRSCYNDVKEARASQITSKLWDRQTNGQTKKQRTSLRRICTFTMLAALNCKGDVRRTQIHSPFFTEWYNVMTCGDDTEPKGPIIPTVSLRIFTWTHNRHQSFAYKVLAGNALCNTYAQYPHTHTLICQWANSRGITNQDFASPETKLLSLLYSTPWTQNTLSIHDGESPFFGSSVGARGCARLFPSRWHWSKIVCSQLID